MLRQSGQFRARSSGGADPRFQRPGAQRGITILAKNIAINYRDEDQPDRYARPRRLGGEVERMLRMADGAWSWSMPSKGRCPRPSSCSPRPRCHSGHRRHQQDRPPRGPPHEVLDEVFDPFIELGAKRPSTTSRTSSAPGTAGSPPRSRRFPERQAGLRADREPGARPVRPDAPFSMPCTTLDYSDYVGPDRHRPDRLGHRGRPGQKTEQLKAGSHSTYLARSTACSFSTTWDESRWSRPRRATSWPSSGSRMSISATPWPTSRSPGRCHESTVDEPTLSIALHRANGSPFRARRQYSDAAAPEGAAQARTGVERGACGRIDLGPRLVHVGGRGLLHLSVLIETMAARATNSPSAKLDVIFPEPQRRDHEPFESLVIEVPACPDGPGTELIGRPPR